MISRQRRLSPAAGSVPPEREAHGGQPSDAIPIADPAAGTLRPAITASAGLPPLFESGSAESIAPVDSPAAAKDDAIAGNNGMDGQEPPAIPVIYGGWVQRLPQGRMRRRRRQPSRSGRAGGRSFKPA